MADVFIGYKSERRNAAQHLARILELNGYSVWFDYDLISGKNLARQIEREIRPAKAVIVLWCSLSRDSGWVLEAGHLAARLGTLVPAYLEHIDLPFGFNRAETIDLSVWDGAPRSHLLDRLLAEIARRVGRDPVSNIRALEEYEHVWRSFGAPSLTQFALTAPIEESNREMRFVEQQNTRHTKVDAGPQPKVFISYRREDSRYQAKRIHDALVEALPREHVFMDVDSMALGVDYVELLAGWIAKCDILLALIGPNWTEAPDPKTKRRRLDNPTDFVRIEIREALRRGIQVVPVLLDVTSMPAPNDLPKDIRDLTRRQAALLQFRTFDSDVSWLIGKIANSGAITQTLVEPSRAFSPATDAALEGDGFTTFNQKASYASKILRWFGDVRRRR